MVRCLISKVKRRRRPKVSELQSLLSRCSGVTCPSGSGDNTTTTTPTGRVVTEYFDLDTERKLVQPQYRVLRCTGADTTREGYWYVDINNKIQKGCLPDSQTRTSDSRQENHYSSAVYWNSPIGRNSEPPYAKCYRAWKTDNATSCYRHKLV